MNSANRPNILYIITDQQSADMIGAKGKHGLHTPHLDRLMLRGVSFENTYCTNPVCVPSRVSLLSGRPGGEVGCRHNTACGSKEATNGDYESLIEDGIARRLSAAGYECVYGGKEHFPYYTAEDLGFEILTLDEREELSVKGAEYIAGRTESEQPFFFVASFINPHDVCYSFRYILEQMGAPDQNKIAGAARPYVEASLADFLVRNAPPLPINLEPQSDEPPCVSSQKANVRDAYSEDHWNMLRYSYNRLTEQVDREIGKLLSALRESGQEENTLVIFTSDHGEMAGSHRKVTKGMFYDECCRVPLLVAGPGIGHGRVDHDQLISNGLDIVPTILDYAGIGENGQLPGYSMRGILENTDVSFPRTMAPMEGMMGFAVQTREYLFAVYDDGDNREQLYHMESNRLQMKNNLKDPSMAADLASLRALLIDTFDKYMGMNEEYRRFQKPDWWQPGNSN